MRPDSHQHQPAQSNGLMPPLSVGELAPNMQVVLIDRKGLRLPERFIVTSELIYNNAFATHVVASSEDHNNRTVALRPSSIATPSKDEKDGQRFRLYRAQDIDMDHVSGLFTRDVTEIAGAYLACPMWVGYDDDVFPDPVAEFKRRLSKADLEVITGDTTLADGAYAAFHLSGYQTGVVTASLIAGGQGERVIRQRYDFWDDEIDDDDDGRRIEETVWVRVPDDKAPGIQVEGFDVDRCGVPVTPDAIDDRVAAIAHNFQRIADLENPAVAARRSRVIPATYRGIQPVAREFKGSTGFERERWQIVESDSSPNFKFSEVVTALSAVAPFADEKSDQLIRTLTALQAVSEAAHDDHVNDILANSLLYKGTGVVARPTVDLQEAARAAERALRTVTGSVTQREISDISIASSLDI